LAAGSFRYSSRSALHRTRTDVYRPLEQKCPGGHSVNDFGRRLKWTLIGDCRVENYVRGVPRLSRASKRAPNDESGAVCARAGAYQIGRGVGRRRTFRADLSAGLVGS
jgi:hypothetical protein